MGEDAVKYTDKASAEEVAAATNDSKYVTPKSLENLTSGLKDQNTGKLLTLTKIPFTFYGQTITNLPESICGSPYVSDSVAIVPAITSTNMILYKITFDQSGKITGKSKILDTAKTSGCEGLTIRPVAANVGAKPTVVTASWLNSVERAHGLVNANTGNFITTLPWSDYNRNNARNIFETSTKYGYIMSNYSNSSCEIKYANKYSASFPNTITLSTTYTNPNPYVIGSIDNTVFIVSGVSSGNPTLISVDLNSGSPTYTQQSVLTAGYSYMDWVYNSVSNKFYCMGAGNLIVFDPISRSFSKTNISSVAGSVGGTYIGESNGSMLYYSAGSGVPYIIFLKMTASGVDISGSKMLQTSKIFLGINLVPVSTTPVDVTLPTNPDYLLMFNSVIVNKNNGYVRAVNDNIDFLRDYDQNTSSAISVATVIRYNNIGNILSAAPYSLGPLTSRGIMYSSKGESLVICE